MADFQKIDILWNSDSSRAFIVIKLLDPLGRIIEIIDAIDEILLVYKLNTYYQVQQLL